MAVQVFVQLVFVVPQSLAVLRHLLLGGFRLSMVLAELLPVLLELLEILLQLSLVA